MDSPSSLDTTFVRYPKSTNPVSTNSPIQEIGEKHNTPRKGWVIVQLSALKSISRERKKRKNSDSNGLDGRLLAWRRMFSVELGQTLVSTNCASRSRSLTIIRSGELSVETSGGAAATILARGSFLKFHACIHFVSFGRRLGGTRVGGWAARRSLRSSPYYLFNTVPPVWRESSNVELYAQLVIPYFAHSCAWWKM